MKGLTEKEKWYIKGYADALQLAMYELTGDNTCSKSYDPISFGDGYIASYAFRFKNCGRRHELSEFANRGEIEMLMLNQACEWIRNEIEHYTDMIQSNKQQKQKQKQDETIYKTRNQRPI